MKPRAEGTASEYFGTMSDSYDSLIRRAVPRYDEMIERLIAYLPTDAACILELGCGTGNFSLALAGRYPQSTLVLVDAAPEMLAEARSRLQTAFPEVAGRAKYLNARFEELTLETSSYDLVTSTISLHHVRDKAPLYQAIHKSLHPGGHFCFADQLAGGSQANSELNWNMWLAFCREPGHCTEEEVASLVEHAGLHDYYTPLFEQFRLLEQAGFVELDCVWRNWMWGIVTAAKIA